MLVVLVRPFSSPAAAWVVLGLGLAATAVVSLISRHQVLKREGERFSVLAEVLQRSMVERLEQYEQVLRGAAGLFAASQSVSRSEWRNYYESLGLPKRYPGIQTLEYREWISSAKLHELESRARPGESNDDAVADFIAWRADNRDEHHRLKCLEPLELNQKVIRDDESGSEPFRRQAAEEARDTGEATLSHKIRLMQSPESPGLFLILPIYRNGSHPASLEQRRANLQGWVTALLTVKELMADIVGVGGRELGYEIYDGDTLSAETWLGGTLPPPGTAARRRPSSLECNREVSFARRRWTLRCFANEAFRGIAGDTAPLLISLGGSCISLLLFGAAKRLVITHQGAIALADSMTARVRLLDRALGHARSGIFILNASQEGFPVVYANSAVAALTGHSLSQLVGYRLPALLSREGGGRYPAGLEALLKEGRDCPKVCRMTRRDGTQFWGELSTAPIREGNGRIVYWVGILDDVSEAKRAEQALQDSKERLDLVIRGSSDGIWDWNVKTGEVYFSARWKSMLGYADYEIQNSFASWEGLLHPEDRAPALAEIQAYFLRKTPKFELEHRLRHKDGTYRWILARGLALWDADGRPLRLAGSHMDLTERKQAEEELRQANEELARSQRQLKETVQALQASHAELEHAQMQLIQAAKMECIGTLAAGVAHEVKNPLQTILTGLDYLQGLLPEPAEGIALALSDMRDAVRRADTIVRELLQLSAQTGFEFKDEDLNAVVTRSLSLLNSELLAAQVEVVRGLAPSLPPVRMDARKMEQVLLNLFINAIQATTPPGILSVRTRSGCLGEDLQLNGRIAGQFRRGERLVVAEVQDSGPGVAPEHLARVFDPFFTTKPVGQGTGLGLAVVKKIMDLHQGALEIRNVPEGGAVVTLAFRVQGASP